MVPSTGKPRVLAASSKTTVHHAQQLLRSYHSHFYRIVLGAGTTDTEVCTRVRARFWSKSGGISSCVSPNLAAFSTVSKKNQSRRVWLTGSQFFFYSSSSVAPPLGFQSKASWCTELESPASPTSHRPPNFRMRLHQAAVIRLLKYTHSSSQITLLFLLVSGTNWINDEVICSLIRPSWSTFVTTLRSSVLCTGISVCASLSRCLYRI